jgi:hypothetical protein
MTAVQDAVAKWIQLSALRDLAIIEGDAKLTAKKNMAKLSRTKDKGKMLKKSQKKKRIEQLPTMYAVVKGIRTIKPGLKSVLILNTKINKFGNLYSAYPALPGGFSR